MNNIPKGYKQTEAGVIPEDWEVKHLDQLVQFTNGKAHENCIKDDGKYIVVNSKFISSEGQVKKYSDESFSLTEAENILMVMSDVPNGKAIAKCFFVDKDNYYTVNQRICSLNIKVDYPKFLFYIIDRNKYYLAFDDGVKQTNLRKDDVLACPIPLPPTKAEQTTIAAALSDADALTNSLEKLIAKKRNIKQGAMQELLTGKKRLPVFSRKWEVKKLGEIADFSNGKAHENFIVDSGKYIVVNSKFISSEGEIIKYSDNCFCPASIDDILMVMSDIPNGKAIAKCFLVDRNEKYTVNQRICLLHTKGVDSKFLFYKINRNPYYLTFDDGVKQTNLRKEDVLNCELDISVDKSEQTAIAQILSNMDAEIEQVEQKLAKYRQIKQGMMQELLTGRIRLV